MPMKTGGGITEILDTKMSVFTLNENNFLKLCFPAHADYNPTIPTADTLSAPKAPSVRSVQSRQILDEQQRQGGLRNEWPARCHRGVGFLGYPKTPRNSANLLKKKKENKIGKFGGSASLQVVTDS